LPDRPDVLLAAALHRYPAAGQREAGPLPEADRRSFLQVGLKLLASSPEPLAASQMRTKARLHEEIGEHDAALAAYQLALEDEPQQIQWRFEMAQVLASLNKNQDAAVELRRVLARQPGHAGAQALLKRLRETPAHPTDR
jgi:predicted Zn-dependent protease